MNLKRSLFFLAISVAVTKASAQTATFASSIKLQQPKNLQQDLQLHAEKKDSSESYTNTAGRITSEKESATLLSSRFKVFNTHAGHQTYQITIAADVPDNKRPLKVYHKKETGHVFLILEQKDTLTQKSVAQVFGFYPVRPVSSLLMRTVKCKILNNGGRVYDAALTQQLTKEQFETVLKKAIELSCKKYNLNKYNCYNYAIEVFNSIPGIEYLQPVKTKFPFVFGKGGSPCGLYKQLLAVNETDSRIKISIGMLKAPISTMIQ
jgi:hypothetical protein